MGLSDFRVILTPDIGGDARVASVCGSKGAPGLGRSDRARPAGRNSQDIIAVRSGRHGSPAVGKGQQDARRPRAARGLHGPRDRRHGRRRRKEHAEDPPARGADIEDAVGPVRGEAVDVCHRQAGVHLLPGVAPICADQDAVQGLLRLIEHGGIDLVRRAGVDLDIDRGARLECISRWRHSLRSGIGSPPRPGRPGRSDHHRSIHRPCSGKPDLHRSPRRLSSYRGHTYAKYRRPGRAAIRGFIDPAVVDGYVSART